MKNWIVFFCASIFTLNTNAQFDFGAINAHSEALGGIQSVQQYAYSAIGNQAGLAGLTSFAVGLSAQNNYLLEGLNSFSIAAALPTKSGTFGFGLQYQGLAKYSELKAGISYGRKLLDNLAIGAQIHVYNLNITNYGSASFVNFELGLQADLTSQLLIGAHIRNPIKMNVIADDQLPVPTTITAGLKYTASKKAMVMAEAEKTVNRPAILKAGLQYQFKAAFALLLGVKTDPAAFSFGAKWQIKSLEVVLTASYHTVLGYSPMLSVFYKKLSSEK